MLVAIANIIFGVLTILISIWIVGRLAGKLKLSINFLIVGAAIFIVGRIITIFNFLSEANLEIAIGIMNTLLILFVLLAVISMKQMIDGVDGHHKRK